MKVIFTAIILSSWKHLTTYNNDILLLKLETLLVPFSNKNPIV